MQSFNSLGSAKEWREASGEQLFVVMDYLGCRIDVGFQGEHCKHIRRKKQKG